MRLQIWTYVVQFFQIFILGSKVNAWSIGSHLTHWTGSWEQKKLIYKVWSQSGQNIGIGDKKRKMPVVKLTTAAMPYNFPERIFVIKLIFWRQDLTLFLLKKEIFWPRHIFPWGLNLVFSYIRAQIMGLLAWR